MLEPINPATMPGAIRIASSSGDESHDVRACPGAWIMGPGVTERQSFVKILSFLRVSLCALLLGGALTVASFNSASAHVGLTPSRTNAGSSALLTFAFSHGCDGSSTTRVAIQIPEQFLVVRPGMNYGWTVEKVVEALATPVAVGHSTVTERVTEVIYTAKEPVLDGFYDAFVLSVTLPTDTAGETFYFPVIQTCEEGENAWIQIPAEGEDGEELESPAPSITISEPIEESD